MTFAALKLKIMPESPETDLDKLKPVIQSRLEKFGAKLNSTLEEPVAFGLKALIVTIAWPEDKSTEEAVEELLHMKEISSIDVIDFRRAFG